MALSAFAHQRDVVAVFGLRLRWERGKDFLPWLSKSRRYEYGRTVRRIEQKAPYYVNLCLGAPVPMEVVDQLVAYKRDWAVRHGKEGLFQHPNVHDFLRQLVAKAAEQKRLALVWLDCGDKSFSYHLWFVHRGMLVSFITAHDPAWRQYSPGNTALVQSVMWAIDSGFAGVEHGQGGGYKIDYSDQSWACAEFTFAGSLKGKLMEAAFVATRGLSRAARKARPEAEGVMRSAAGLRKPEVHGEDAPS